MKEEEIESLVITGLERRRAEVHHKYGITRGYLRVAAHQEGLMFEIGKQNASYISFGLRDVRNIQHLEEWTILRIVLV